MTRRVAKKRYKKALDAMKRPMPGMSAEWKSLQSHAERCTVYHIKAPENSVYTCKGD